MGAKTGTLSQNGHLQRTAVWPTWLAWAICGVSLGLCAIALSIVAITFSTPTPAAWGFRGYNTLLAIAFAVLGALTASRNPGNPVGWLTCAVGISTGFQALAVEYAVYSVLARPGSLPYGDVAAWFISWYWLVQAGVFAPIILFLFPNGRPLSPAWRAGLWATPLAALVAIAGFALLPGPVDQYPSLQNPFGIAALGDYRWVLPLGMLLVVCNLAASAVSLGLRFQRSEGNERQQLKWLAYATSIGAFFFGIDIIEQIVWRTHRTDFLVIFSFLTIPFAVGVAILKYRLYDIDVVINRTLVYVPMTAILAGFYIAGIGVLKSVFTNFTGLGSDVAVAFTTVLVVAMLTPLKNSLQTFVDKRFKETPDPKKKIRALTEQVKGVIQVLSEEQMAQRLLRDASSAYEAEYAAVRLYRDGNPERVFAEGQPVDSPHISIPLECGQECLGELVMGPRRGGRQYADEDKAALELCAKSIGEALTVARSARLRV